MRFSVYAIMLSAKKVLHFPLLSVHLFSPVSYLGPRLGLQRTVDQKWRLWTSLPHPDLSGKVSSIIMRCVSGAVSMDASSRLLLLREEPSSA